MHGLLRMQTRDGHNILTEYPQIAKAAWWSWNVADLSYSKAAYSKDDLQKVTTARDKLIFSGLRFKYRSNEGKSKTICSETGFKKLSFASQIDNRQPMVLTIAAIRTYCSP